MGDKARDEGERENTGVQSARAGEEAEWGQIGFFGVDCRAALDFAYHLCLAVGDAITRILASCFGSHFLCSAITAARRESLG